MSVVRFELTDTYGGEANYAWLRTTRSIVESTVSDLALVRRAKKWAGWNGHPCKVDRFGDMIALHPQGICQVLFIAHEF